MKEEQDEYFNKENKKQAIVKTDKRIKQLVEQREKSLGLTKCIIVDVDGTLSLMNNRHVYNAEQSVNDQVNHPVKQLCNLYYAEDYVVILMTGRQESERKVTEEFLKKNSIWHDTMIMRATGDYRKDSIIKKELYEKHIEGIYHVEFVLDDRNQVVDMWRDELGLPCFQVFYGDF